MAYIAVTNTFTNGSVADAGAVNTNFTDIINGLSDGTKDLSVAAITAAGTTTLNGAVSLGNATSDDITITGYVASAIVPKTDDTYDLGTSTLAWQDLYLEGTCYTDAIAPLGTTIGISAAGAVSIGSTGAGVAITTHSTAGDDFTVNSTALVVEGDTGFIGIGTASPDSKLRVIGGLVYIDGAGSDSSGYSLLCRNSVPANIFAVRNDGNVGIGTASPTCKMDADTGSIKGGFFTTNQGSTSVNNSTATTLTALTDGSMGLFTVWLQGNNPQYYAFALVGRNGVNYLLNQLAAAGSGVALSLSGANIQLTHTIGSAYTFYWSFMSLRSTLV